MHADAVGRGDLLGPAQRGHLLPREVLVESAGVAVGHDAVDDLDPGLRPACDRSRRAEVNVVGMGGDGKDPGNLGVIEHARHLSLRSDLSRSARLPALPIANYLRNLMSV